MKDVATKLGLEVVPSFKPETLRAATAGVRLGTVTSFWKDVPIEGLVGRPLVDLFTRKGERIVAKIKGRDFKDYERRGPIAKASVQ